MLWTIFTLFRYGDGKIWCFMLKAMHKKLEFQNEVVKNGDGNSGESTQTLGESLQKMNISLHDIWIMRLKEVAKKWWLA